MKAICSPIILRHTYVREVLKPIWASSSSQQIRFKLIWYERDEVGDSIGDGKTGVTELVFVVGRSACWYEWLRTRRCRGWSKVAWTEGTSAIWARSTLWTH